ncbi:MAG: hypothetical protein LBV34_12000, partial [Nocardiopsaceae bacterium]|nr:hypothetical protein [Nocardiopsaceae bacterium]
MSVPNALMFNTAAFVGSQITWAPVVYTLAFVPIGIWAGLSTLAWATIAFGIGGVILAYIFASLATVMPKTGGDYVFTSRLIPRVGPFLGWMESVLLVFAILAVVAFEVPVFLLGIKQTGLIIGFGTNSSFFAGATDWFSSNGAIADWPGLLAGLVVFAIIFWMLVQPTRRFHRIITGLAALAIISMPLMWICQLIFVSRADFQDNFSRFTGSELSAVQKAA